MNERKIAQAFSEAFQNMNITSFHVFHGRDGWYVKTNAAAVYHVVRSNSRSAFLRQFRKARGLTFVFLGSGQR